MLQSNFSVNHKDAYDYYSEQIMNFVFFLFVCLSVFLVFTRQFASF